MCLGDRCLLQVNPAHPGLRLHKLDKPKDPNFLSVRVNKDIRVIIHRTDASLLLCYVDHRDKAYQWAVRRRIETHSKTGRRTELQALWALRRRRATRVMKSSPHAS